MRIYDISTGCLYDDKPSGLDLIATGFSGFESASNDPARQGEKGIGPLPAGAYDIGDPYSDPKLGPVVMKLTPLGKTDVLGRDGSTFRIHGMSSLGPKESSHGCLLFDRSDREKIAAGSRLLVAVSRLPEFSAV